LIVKLEINSIILSNTFQYFKYSFIVLFLGSVVVTAQEDDWDSFLAEKEKGIMAITTNFRYVQSKPTYKNLLIVGSNTKKCFKNGAPKVDGLEEIYTFSDAAASVIDQSTKNRLVGILTYQCSGFDVYYVKDTTNLRKDINKLFQDKSPKHNNYLYIQRDKRWKYFSEVLYPKDISDSFFANQEYLNQLFYKGLDFSKKRKVTHWASFKKEKRRQKFLKKIKVLNFKVDSLKFNKDKNQLFEVQFSREDNFNPDYINEVTKILGLLSTSCNGYYDGWEIENTKEE